MSEQLPDLVEVVKEKPDNRKSVIDKETKKTNSEITNYKTNTKDTVLNTESRAADYIAASGKQRFTTFSKTDTRKKRTELPRAGEWGVEGENTVNEASVSSESVADRCATTTLVEQNIRISENKCPSPLASKHLSSFQVPIETRSLPLLKAKFPGRVASHRPAPVSNNESANSDKAPDPDRYLPDSARRAVNRSRKVYSR